MRESSSSVLQGSSFLLSLSIHAENGAHPEKAFEACGFAPSLERERFKCSDPFCAGPRFYDDLLATVQAQASLNSHLELYVAHCTVVNSESHFRSASQGGQARAAFAFAWAQCAGMSGLVSIYQER